MQKLKEDSKVYNDRGELGDARYKEHLIYFLAFAWLMCPVPI